VTRMSTEEDRRLFILLLLRSGYSSDSDGPHHRRYRALTCVYCVNTGVGCDPYVRGGRPTTVYRGGRRTHHEGTQGAQTQRSYTGGNQLFNLVTFVFLSIVFAIWRHFRNDLYRVEWGVKLHSNHMAPVSTHV